MKHTKVEANDGHDYEAELKERRRKARLFPKSKFNWRAAPLLIRYRPEHYEKILNMDNVQEDDRMVYKTLMAYCDCDRKGRPAKHMSEPNYLKLRDGRMISLHDIIDAIWDSAHRQKEKVKTFLNGSE